MKPMSIKDYTLPVGSECCIPSYEEALNFFRSRGWLGDVCFGLAETDTHDIMGWGIRCEKIYRVVSAFRNVKKAPINAFYEMETGSRFVYRGHTYVVTRGYAGKPLIREMTALPCEDEIRGSLSAQGKKDFTVYAVKMFEIGRTNRYLAPAWYVEMPEDSEEADAFMPIFFSDLPLLDSIPVNSLNWEFMSPGDSFIHNHEIWRLYENEKRGLFVNRFPFKMKIFKG